VGDRSRMPMEATIGTNENRSRKPGMTDWTMRATAGEWVDFTDRMRNRTAKSGTAHDPVILPIISSRQIRGPSLRTALDRYASYLLEGESQCVLQVATEVQVLRTRSTKARGS
jgi:hypothetical protein